jgi:DNA-binding NarL/FixJ family response regulator
MSITTQSFFSSLRENQNCELPDQPPRLNPALHSLDCSDTAEALPEQIVMKRIALRRSPSKKSDHPPSAPDKGIKAKAPLRPNEIPGPYSRNGVVHRPQSTRPYIVVIHQRAFIRECFVRCLEASYAGHDVVALESVTAWRDFEDEARVSPTVIVYFVEGRDPSNFAGLDVLEEIAAEAPVLIVSDTDDVNDVVRAFKSGVRGYIPTSLSFNVVVEVVRLIQAGGTYLPANFALQEKRSGEASKANDLLTERQLMVVGALCQGMANKQIAYKLSMSEHTVKVHLRHIMRKLNARNRTEVAILSKSFNFRD